MPGDLSRSVLVVLFIAMQNLGTSGSFFHNCPNFFAVFSFIDFKIRTFPIPVKMRIRVQ